MNFNKINLAMNRFPELPKNTEIYINTVYNMTNTKFCKKNIKSFHYSEHYRSLSITFFDGTYLSFNLECIEFIGFENSSFNITYC